MLGLVQRLSIEDLLEGNSYIVDLGSLPDLFGEQTVDRLSGKRDVNWADAIRLWHNEDHRVQHMSRDAVRSLAWKCAASVLDRPVQRTIESLVVADRLAIDDALLVTDQRLGFDLEASFVASDGILVQIEVPTATRKVIWERLSDYGTSEMHEIYGNALSPRGIQNPFHQGDKTISDFLHRLGGRYDASWFADSHEHPLRALYYLLLSEEFRLPVCLSWYKMNYIDQLLTRNAQEVQFELAKPENQRELAALPNPSGLDMNVRIKGIIQPQISIAGSSLLPPIVELVTAHALENRLSLGAAALKVRGTEEAMAYRHKLRELRQQFLSPTLPRQSDAARYLQELRTAASIWSKDPYEGIEYITQQAHAEAIVSAIPQVGSLLSTLLPSRLVKALGKRLDAPDPVHLFVSRWFRLDEEKTADLT